MENLEKVIKFATQAFTNIYDASADGKISLGETFDIIRSQIFAVPDLLAAIPNLKQEWQQSSRESRDELLDLVKASIELPNEKLEIVVESVCTMLSEAYNIYLAFGK